ncbi:MAG TPA: FtsX-like permease family protein, partial [Solirubrobacteraceae bacterium]|nr:FtsX-like permease family protein [Solirubrobacteraceae bacterium]
MSALRLAVARLRARPGRAALTAAGILAAGAMAGTAVTVGVSLGTGFERAADRAQLPDVIARFHPRGVRFVAAKVAALPNVAAASYRLELTDIPLRAGGRRTGAGGVQVVIGEGRRGYAVVEGRDVSQRRGGEVVVERGLASVWGLGVGSRLDVGRLDGLRVVGIAVGPDNVAYPLSRSARVYLPARPLERGLGRAPASVLQIWLRNRDRLDETLVQARAVSAGLRDLRFITRSGVQILLDQAAGIVIALLVAFSVVALLAAGFMLGASARAEVQRRLRTIGVQRALGFARREVVATHAVEAALVAAPAAAAGLALGALLSAGPTGALLETLNELPPGAALLAPLAVAGAAMVALVVAASIWPAYRAASGPPAAILRGGDLAGTRTPRARAAGPATSPVAGFLGLGARLAAARRGRLGATVVVLGVAAGVVLLLLALAGLLERLQNDPALLGRRYQLTVPAAQAGA